MSPTKLSLTKQAHIASAVSNFTDEERDAMYSQGLSCKNIEHPYMYCWNEDRGECPEDADEWMRAEWNNWNLSWYVGELREVPDKFPEAQLGWYVIQHREGSNERAVEGPFENWLAAATSADKYGIRHHLHRNRY